MPESNSETWIFSSSSSPLLLFIPRCDRIFTWIFTWIFHLDSTWIFTSSPPLSYFSSPVAPGQGLTFVGANGRLTDNSPQAHICVHTHTHKCKNTKVHKFKTQRPADCAENTLSLLLVTLSPFFVIFSSNYYFLMQGARRNT